MSIELVKLLRGQVVKYIAILACGNYHGLVGFVKAKGPAIPIALQKAYEKCFQNLHYVEWHEEHTISHAVQTAYKKTKVFLWPAPTRTGMKAGKTVQTILNLAGFKNIKSKVVGSRNPNNTFKALFKALNAVSCPSFNTMDALKLQKSVNCNFVQWIDGEICTRAKQIITGLVRKANKLEAKILQLEKAN